ncbi:Uu.00g001330.m01.CDS01 [Anthostomella pinea]|uniref:Iron-sulfur cluster assembly factor IBA57 homolog, mitochondrial n=1 Tax=Anthostomella pinea TaxID=933095 RepID=A0AAI8VJF3_9PEZI|nr:Uu.00g001330.m01.CDS01 [Anthostomella pinea]
MSALPRNAPRRGLKNLNLSLGLGPRAPTPFICSSCRRSQLQTQPQSPPPRRHFSATTGARGAAAPPPPPPPSSGFARLTSRRLISIAGADAPRFLQGIITSSISANPRNASAEPSTPRTDGFYSGFLNATGRVLHDVFIYPDTVGAAGDLSLGAGEAFIIEVDAERLGDLLRHLRRYKLRSKLKVRALEEGECAAWQVWDDGAPETGAEMEAPRVGKEDGIVLRDTRAPGMGYRVLSKRADGPQLDMEQTADTAYRIRRYLHGVAEGQGEMIREQALPLDSNMDLMGGIDFRKGCYVGQELTIRTKHRGVVRKRILPCVLYDPTTPPPQRLEYSPDSATQALPAEHIPAGLSIGRDGKKGRSAGNWLSGVGNVGLALCRLQIMTDIELPGETATAPFDPADEFVMKMGTDEDGDADKGRAVKVKAFVPEWLRRRLDESNTSTH